MEVEPFLLELFSSPQFLVISIFVGLLSLLILTYDFFYGTN